MRTARCALIAMVLVGSVQSAAADPTPAAQPAPAQAASPPSAATRPAAAPGGPAAAPAPPAQAPANTDERMDVGLERLNAKDYKEAAAVLYGVYRSLPDNDLRRDLASFHLAGALVELGYRQAGIEHYLEVLGGRRLPEFMDKALGKMKVLYEERVVDEDRFVDGTIYGNQYAEVSPEVGDFVEYLQALADVRRGFEEWGRKRLEVLSKGTRGYAFSARYALAVDRIARHQDAAAARDLHEILAAGLAVPEEIRNDARVALARILYERKLYDEAWKTYSQVTSPLPLQDLVMVEKAWDRTAGGDLQRALGLIVGLGAPVFRDIFAPERDLIRAMVLRQLCQYRAAHVAVREFRSSYGPALKKIRDRVPTVDDSTMRRWAIAGTRSLVDKGRLRALLTREREALSSVRDKALHDHLDAIYAADLARINGILARRMPQAMDRVADELLRIDEQMNLIDYEIGAGLFKSGEAKENHGTRPEEVPFGTQDVFFRFDGEYWSDEVGDYTVLADDRCLR
jgi:hypothetical protein